MAPDIVGYDNRVYHSSNQRTGYIQLDCIKILRSTRRTMLIAAGVD
jgi:hypothetical protein